MNPSRLLSVILIALVLLNLPRPGFCQSETLSRFLQANLNSRLIVLEGDCYIDHNRQELDKIVRGNTTAWQKVSEIAGKCDYEAVQYQGAYLLNKRYSDLNELPCVSTEELVEFSEEVFRAVSPMLTKAGEITGTKVIHNLLLSLPEDEWKLVQQEPLPVQRLSTQSKQNLVNLFTESFYGGLRNYSNLVRLHCQNLDDAQLEIASFPDGISYFQLRVYTEGKAGEAWSIMPRDNAVAGEFDAEKALYVNASFSSTKIQDVLKELNNRSEGKITFSASVSLLHKPVSVSGLETSPPAQVLRCIARLYNLRVLARSGTTGNRMELARERFIPDPNVDILHSVAASLPSPLRKTLVKRSYDPPTKGLIFRLLPEAQKQKSKSLPVRDLGRLEKIAIVLNVFQQMGTEVSHPTPMPSYLNQLDTLYVKCKRTPGQPMEFTIVSENKGVKAEGPVYTLFTDVPRN